MNPIAHVIVDAPLPQPLDYRFELGDPATVPPGTRCVVPLGRRRTVGLLVGFADRSSLAPQRLRAVEALLGDLPPLSGDWLDLTRFAAQYYQQGWGEVALPALPQPFRVLPGPRFAASLARMRAAAATPPAAGGGPPTQPNPDQAAAIAAISAALRPRPGPASGYAPFLLHGVTGSGKTEVYLQAIAAALQAGGQRQVLLLVPEINLTPQLQGRLAERFPEQPIVALHSGMPDAERAAAWLAAHEGRARIVIGTRLAVFASLPGLGLIVVDEEHDPSYKAGDGVRYSARDLAVKRAQLAGVPVVLGSATPALESWAAARAGRYTRLALPQRAQGGGTLPTIELVDLGRHPAEGGLAAPVRAALADTLARHEQALVFLNRRGYAPVVCCGACGWLSDCPRCSTFAAYHKVDAVLRCHHCGWQGPVPRTCPTCGNQDLRAVGQGTQRVEERLAAEFPQARLARIDRDSTRRRHAAREALARVHEGATDILVGTQMIAKGHDFRRVTLVAVLNADAQLVATDFRAPERLFATLMQVAGRAGRGELPGRVVIQTQFVGHPLFAALQRHAYAEFADRQLDERRQAGLPPFSGQALLTAEARSLEAALDWLAAARDEGAALLDPSGSGRGAAVGAAQPPATGAAATPPVLDPAVAHRVRLLDPVPMPLQRLASVHRAQLLVEADTRGVLQAFLPAWLAALRAPAPGGPARPLRWAIDVDPQHI